MSNNQILCSVLLPCRYRIDGIKKCIRTISTTAEYPESIEFILRLDDDDTDTIRGINNEFLRTCDPRLPEINVTVLIGRRLIHLGFAKMFAALFDECANASRGKWQWLANNDMYIVDSSKGWDLELLKVPTTGFIVSPGTNIWNNYPVTWTRTQGAWHTAHFPIVPANWWKSFGLSGIQHPVDTFSLNYLTGRGYQGDGKGIGWNIWSLGCLTTHHTQNPDKCFRETTRNNFTD